MDLVAAAISSSEVKGGMSGDEKSGVAVTVHRLPWSKTYTLNPPPDDAPTKTPPVPCSMAWSPDGKKLVIGWSQGRMSVFGLEPTKELGYVDAGDEPVTWVSWAEFASVSLGVSKRAEFVSSVFKSLGSGNKSAGDDEGDDDDDNSVVDSPSSGMWDKWRAARHGMAGAALAYSLASSESEKAQGNSTEETPVWAKASDESGAGRQEVVGGLPLLVGASNSGRVVASLGGAVEVVDVNLGPDAGNVMGVVMGPGNGRLWVITSGSVNGTVAHSIRTPGLAGWRASDLAYVVSSLSRIAGICCGMERAVTDMKGLWHSKVQLLRDKLSSLHRLLHDSGRTTTPLEEAFEVIATGAASPAMAQFLTQTFDAAAVARLEAALIGALKALEGMALDKVSAGAEAVMFCVGDLLSASSALPRLAQLGLSAAEVQAALSAANGVMVTTEAFLRAVADQRRYLSLFLSWMGRASQVLSGEEEEADDGGASQGRHSHELVFDTQAGPGSSGGMAGGWIPPQAVLEAALERDPVTRALSGTGSFPDQLYALSGRVNGLLSVVSDNCSGQARVDKSIDLWEAESSWADVRPGQVKGSAEILFGSGSQGAAMGALVMKSGEFTKTSLPAGPSGVRVARWFNEDVLSLEKSGEIRRLVGGMDDWSLEESRVRNVGHAARAGTRLGVSGSRGVGCLMTPAAEGSEVVKRVTVFDFEEDEEEDDEGEEGDEMR